MLGRRTRMGVAVVALWLGACGSEPDAGGPDPRLVTHAIAPSTPTPEGLAYLASIADVLEQAESNSGSARIAILRDGLARPVPANLGEAEILRLELVTRLGESLAETPEGVVVARDLLVSTMPVDRSLPLDMASARALVTLGDVAAKTGDDALAAGSYARAIRLMSLLRQELEP